MTPGNLYDLIGKKYLRWNFDTFSRKDRLLPVLRPVFIETPSGEPQIKLEYYKKISCKRSDFLSSEYLDAGLSDEELLRIIDARMRSDKWFERPEYFTAERCDSLPLPVGSLKIVEWIETIRRSFTVASAGYGAAFQDAAGRSVSTETVFDVCVPTERLEVGVWYELFFECDSEHKARWRGFDKYSGSKASLVLTGALGSWSYGVSAYNSRSDPQLRDSYEVRYAPDGNGFLFRVMRKELERIWFKAAWLKSEGTDRSLCRQALRRWLE